MESPTTRFRLNGWQVEPDLDTIASAQSSIKLDPRPMQVLVFLARNAGRVLNQRQIEGAVWGEVLVTTNSVYQCITQLRRALGDDAKLPQYIQTIPRKGYRLIANVEWLGNVHAVADPPTTYQASAAAENDAATSQAAVPPAPPAAARPKWRVIGAGIGLVLIAGIGVEAKRIAGERALAQRERERAEQVSQLMLEVFSAADPFVNLGRPITARELLEQGAQLLKADLNQQPLLRAQLLETIGRSYRRQGLHELAVPALEEALQIRRAKSGAQAEIGSLLAELGVAFHSLGRFADSDSAFDTALQIRNANAARPSRQYARLMADIGTLELARSHPNQAVQLLNDGLQLLRRLKDADQQQIAAILEGLGNAYLWLDDIERAEQSVRAAYQIHRNTLPELHPDRVMTSYGLGEVLRLQGRSAEAEPLLLAALTAQRRLYSSKGAQVATTLGSLALLKYSQGSEQEAEKLAREAAAATQPDGKPDQSGYVQIELARQLMSRDDFAAAEKVARATLDSYSARLPLDPQYVAAAEHFLGEALLGQKRLGEAEQVLRSSVERWRKIDALGWRSARCISTLGEVLYHQGRIPEAEPLLLAGYRTVAVDLGADQQTKRRIYQRLSRFYRETGRADALVQLEASTSQFRGQQPGKE